MIFAHFALAAAGLVLWIIYLFVDHGVLAVATVVLVLLTDLGIGTMR